MCAILLQRPYRDRIRRVVQIKITDKKFKARLFRFPITLTKFLHSKIYMKCFWLRLAVHAHKIIFLTSGRKLFYWLVLNLARHHCACVRPLPPVAQVQVSLPSPKWRHRATLDSHLLCLLWRNWGRAKWCAQPRHVYTSIAIIAAQCGVCAQCRWLWMNEWMICNGFLVQRCHTDVSRRRLTPTARCNAMNVRTVHFFTVVFLTTHS